MPAVRPYYLGLCAIAKDETPYLREWVAYHHLIGFERIIIYDNESAVPVRDTVADLHAAGLVETYTIQGKAMQLVAYNHCLREHGPECEWLAFLDLDEFLHLKTCDDARTLLGDYEDHGGLVLSVRSFGSSGYLGRPAGLVLDRYREALGVSINVKSIVRPRHVSLIMTPHHCRYNQGWHAVTTDGIPAYGGYAPVTTDVACINHYSVRSQQDYEEKIRRGDAIYENYNPRSLEVFYAQARRVGQRDDGMQQRLSRLTAILDHPQAAPYHAVDSAELRSEPFPAALARLAQALESGNPALARLAFGLSYARFAHKPSYLTLGVRACLACGDISRARKVAADLIALAPVFSSYRELFSVCLAAGDRRQAERMAGFLFHCAHYARDTEAEEAVCQDCAAHGILLSFRDR